MNAAAYVHRAQRWASFLENNECSSHGGDRKFARDQLSRRYPRIASRALYALRYLPPKEIAADLYDALCEAVEDAASRQIKVLEHEIAEARRGRLGPRDSVVSKATTALSQALELLNNTTPGANND